MVIFSFEYPPVGGGISRLVHEIFQGIKRGGSDLPVVITNGKNDNTTNIIRCGLKRPWREICAFLELKRHKKKHDVVLCSIWYPEALLALIAGYKKVFVLGHGNELMPYDSFLRKKIWAKLRQFVIRHTSLMIANSRYTGTLIERCGCNNVKVISLGVDTNRFSPGCRKAAREKLGLDASTSKIIISTVARHDSHKGHETVINALVLLDVETRKKVVYVVSGTGPMTMHLKNYAMNQKVDDIVFWSGEISEELLPFLYRASNMMVLCSIEDKKLGKVEGFGLSLLEAQSCGVAVVGTKIGGIPDAVSNTGILIEPEDPNALSLLIKDCALHPGKFDAIGASARSRVIGGCTWDVYCKKLLDCIKA